MSTPHPVYLQLTVHQYRMNDRLVSNSPFLDIFANDGIVPMAAAYAISKWASSHDVNYLYISGPRFSGADALFQVLRDALRDAPDVIFNVDGVDYVYPEKQVIRLTSPCDYLTDASEHCIITFQKEYFRDIPTPVQLGALILAVSDDMGPCMLYRCLSPNGVCWSGSPKCSVCLDPYWDCCPFMFAFGIDDSESDLDEGICV
ncbi:protein ORF52 [Goose adenovirus 4]|nr:protein ORF52 [Goose adenovirus 4]